jgi:hypothetical protein
MVEKKAGISLDYREASSDKDPPGATSHPHIESNIHVEPGIHLSWADAQDSNPRRNLELGVQLEIY